MSSAPGAALAGRRPGLGGGGGLATGGILGTAVGAARRAPADPSPCRARGRRAPRAGPHRAGLRRGGDARDVWLPRRVRGRARGPAGRARREWARNLRRELRSTGRRAGRGHGSPPAETAAACIAQSLLTFNEQSSASLEVAVVLLVVGAARARGHAAGALARPSALPAHPTHLGRHRPGRRARSRAPARAHRLVRHPRHRLGVLPLVRGHPRVPPTSTDAASVTLLAIARVDRGARHLRDAADGLVRGRIRERDGARRTGPRADSGTL